MLDIRYIRENPDKVQQSAAQKGYSVSIVELLHVDDSRKAIQVEVDQLRTKRNENASQLKGVVGRPEQTVIDEGKRIKLELVDLESRLNEIEADFTRRMHAIPNITFDDVPLGGEADSVEIKQVGPQASGGRDHLDLALEREWVDFERGAKVAGAKFYYLKGDLALLENAITQFALNFVVEKGFNYMTVPHLANQRTMTGTGFAPRTSDQSDEYSIDGEDLSLIGTAEIPLTGYHADEILEEASLPLLYAGYSPCYRREAGAAGKHTRGLFRVHQFNKLEMYAFTLPEQSRDMHEQLLAIEEELWQALGVSYRVINIAAGDLGAPAAKKFDIEYWSPVDGAYRELTSCSNCTSYQARNLNIRVRRSDGSLEIVHSLNGTAVSLARSLIVILEQYQTAEGRVRIPEVLKPYMSGREEI